MWPFQNIEQPAHGGTSQTTPNTCKCYRWIIWGEAVSGSFRDSPTRYSDSPEESFVWISGESAEQGCLEMNNPVQEEGRLHSPWSSLLRLRTQCFWQSSTTTTTSRSDGRRH